MLKESPVKRFPGHVVLPEFLTLPQVLAFESAREQIVAIRQGLDPDARVQRSRLDAIYLPVVCMIVSEWCISGVPEKPEPDNFPMTPRLATAELIAWIIGEISQIYIGEIDIPNA